MINFDKFELDNGLKIIVHKDATTPIVAFNLLYNVGARNESEERTGFAHLFEHLMFGGSKNVKNYDTLLQRAGGENNAFTNNDYTDYYLTIPKQNIETAFYLESDRMLELAFSKNSLEVQRNVVAEEFRQRYLNQPYGDVSLYMRPLAYKVHPYKWSTIGKSIDHVINASIEEVKDFFYNYYAPNNAILVVAGDVDAENIWKLSEKWFGSIPKRNVPRKSIKEEPRQLEKRELVLERDVPSNAVYMAYHMCGRTDKEYYATDLISDLLSNGRSSIFNINLIKGKQLFSELDGYVYGALDPGLFQISGKMYPGISFGDAEKAIKQEILKISSGNFSDRDLRKVKNKAISTQKLSRIGVLNISMELAYYEWLGDAELLNHIEERYEEVGKQQIIEISQDIFTDNNLSCIYYESKNNGDGG